MKVHGARQIAIGLGLGLGPFGRADIEQEFRRLAIDHEHAVAGKEHDRVGSQLAAVLVLRRLLQHEIPPELETEGFERVGEADLGDLPGAARARQRAPQRVERAALVLQLPVQLLHGLGDLVDLRDEGRRMLLDARFRFLARLGILALVVFEQLRGQLLAGRKCRGGRGLDDLGLQALEIPHPAFGLGEPRFGDDAALRLAPAEPQAHRRRQDESQDDQDDDEKHFH